MSWLTRAKAKLGFLRKRDVPDNLWHKCRNCGTMIFRKDFLEALSVCSQCGHHERIGPVDRFAQLFDAGRHQLIALPSAPEDPLRFKDQKRYVDRLKETRAATGANEAFAAALGDMGGVPSVIAVQDFSFMAGSMGQAVGLAFVASVRAAISARAPLVMLTAAGGARMQEGLLSLMQMPRTTVAVAELKEAGLPYIVVLTDPTTGGVTASYAMLGDIHLAEPGALIGFAGQRVIEGTIRERLPDGFQRAEYLFDHGMIDQVVARKDLRATLVRFIGLLMVPQATTRGGQLLAPQA
jgi:acetyl-CoA carboxylase carboxyl transferase subunit beta